MKTEVMREIIKRNREALGLGIGDKKLIDGLVIINMEVSIRSILEVSQSPNHIGGLNMILADGLVVGYK